MNKILSTIGIVLALSLTAQQSFAAGEFDKPIKARQSFMQIYAFNLGLLGAMAKGKRPYDAKLAAAAASNLVAATNMKNSAMWPKGSDSAALGKKVTRAKPENWTNYPDAAKKGKALKTALTKMAAVAGNGLDAVKANIGAVGKGCKGCHKEFRVKKKK